MSKFKPGDLVKIRFLDKALNRETLSEFTVMIISEDRARLIDKERYEKIIDQKEYRDNTHTKYFVFIPELPYIPANVTIAFANEEHLVPLTKAATILYET